MDIPTARKLRPAFAFLANFLGLGLGYLYVGEARLAFATVVGVYATLAFFGWTRLIVYSAAMWWLCGFTVISIFGISVFHPLVIAIRNRNRQSKRYNRWWFYVIWTGAAVALGFLLGTDRAQLFGYEPFYDPSNSMSPTVERGDFFMVDAWRYRSHSPAIGEIVVYENAMRDHVKYVKRIVAGPGDRIEGRDSVLYRNGQPVAESYLHPRQAGDGFGRSFPVTVVGPASVFVLGDNRDNSLDSRETGPIPMSQLHGRAEYIWLSTAKSRVGWSHVSTSLRP